MRSGFARLIVLALLTATTVVGTTTAARAAPSGCPDPTCLYSTMDMRCHEDGWCVVPINVLGRPAGQNVTLDVSTEVLSAGPADFQVPESNVTIPAGARSARVAVWINRDDEREPEEQFLVRIGPVVSVVTIIE